MNAHATSTQALSGTFKHGAGRIILLALGCTVVAAAVVTAVAVRQSAGGDASTATTSAALLEAAQAQHDASIEGTLSQFPEGSAFPALRPSALPEPGLRTTYIVGSQEQADAVALGINDANTIRATTGLSPTVDTVLVVSSDAEAAAVVEAVLDGNRILVTLGEPEEYVVDLRTK
ncbi:MAG: hypothetical protein IH609_20010 [Dehalococcoidia bacterium]|nr:hypothetical protein [Dehalococcoidia bacterium]